MKLNCLKSFLGLVVMTVGLAMPNNVFAEDATTPEWTGTYLTNANYSTLATSSSPCYLYNVGAKAWLINGGGWGTQACLSKDYGLPIVGFSAMTGGNITTGLSTGQGTLLSYITGGYSSDIGTIYCDRETNSTDGEVTFVLDKNGDDLNSYTLYIKVSGTTYYVNGADGAPNPVTADTSKNGDYSKWLIITSAAIKEKLQTSPADLHNPTNITFNLADPNFDRGNTKEASWVESSDWKVYDQRGEGTSVELVTSITSGNEYYISNGTQYMTLSSTGTIGSTTDRSQATKFTITTNGNSYYISANGYYLIHTSLASLSTSQGTTYAAWTFDNNAFRYRPNSTSYYIRYNRGWELSNGNSNRGQAYQEVQGEITATGGINLGVSGLYKTAPSNSYDAYTGDKKSNNDWVHDNGKYCGVETHGVSGTLSQTVKVYYTGWYRVSCEGFYYKEDATTNNVASLFATYGTTTRTKALAMGNTQGTEVPTSWDEALQKIYNTDIYYNGVMIYVDTHSTADYGYIADGVDLTLGIKMAATEYADWVVFDNFQLEFLGQNHNLILKEDNLNHDYLLNTVEEYKNSTLLLNRDFTANAWNTLVLPVSLTKKQFTDAFGADAKAAYLYEIREGVLRFKTVKKEGLDANAYMTTAGKPYIVYINSKPQVTEEYISSLTDKNGDLLEVGIGGTYSGAYYEVPFVTLDKSELDYTSGTRSPGAITGNYSANDTEVANAKVVFNGTYEKTYEGTSIRSGYPTMTNNIVFSGGDLYWCNAPYGMKAYRAWLEPSDEYKHLIKEGESGEAGGAKLSISIDDIEDYTTYIEGINFDSESNAVSAKYNSRIYNINGQLVNNNTSVDNLPKGIYIVNGKKYIVK